MEMTVGLTVDRQAEVARTVAKHLMDDCGYATRSYCESPAFEGEAPALTSSALVAMSLGEPLDLVTEYWNKDMPGQQYYVCIRANIIPPENTDIVSMYRYVIAHATNLEGNRYLSVEPISVMIYTEKDVDVLYQLLREYNLMPTPNPESIDKLRTSSTYGKRS